MTSTASQTPAPHIWLHHLEDEADAAFLYRELAQAERDTHKADLYRKLAAVEDRHVEMWRKLLAENGHHVEPPPPSRGAQAPGLGGAPGRRRHPAPDAAPGGRARGEGLPQPLPRVAGRGGRPDGADAGEGVQGARRDAGVDQRRRRRALAQDRRRRVSPERGLRLQRRADRQLRPGGRDDRRAGQPARWRLTPWWWPGSRAPRPTPCPWARRATSRPRASARCSSTRSRWRRRKSG